MHAHSGAQWIPDWRDRCYISAALLCLVPPLLNTTRTLVQLVVRDVIAYTRDHKLQERPELFVKGESVYVYELDAYTAFTNFYKTAGATWRCLATPDIYYPCT